MAPGTGFETHPHRDMEIVTWVLDGALVHQDSMGHSGVIYPGLAQRMSAGTGILHSEKNDAWRLDGPTPASTRDPVHFVQMWVSPDEARIEPGYEQLDITARARRAAAWCRSRRDGPGRDESAIRIQQRTPRCSRPGWRRGSRSTLPAAPCVHLYVARGAVVLEGAGRLDTGDAVRLTAADGQRLTAGRRTRRGARLGDGQLA